MTLALLLMLVLLQVVSNITLPKPDLFLGATDDRVFSTLFTGGLVAHLSHR